MEQEARSPWPVLDPPLDPDRSDSQGQREDKRACHTLKDRMYSYIQLQTKSVIAGATEVNMVIIAKTVS